MLIPSWVNSYINYNARDEITYPFPNFNGALCGGTAVGPERIGNFITHFIIDVVTHPCVTYTNFQLLFPVYRGRTTKICHRANWYLLDPSLWYVWKFGTSSWFLSHLLDPYQQGVIACKACPSTIRPMTSMPFTNPLWTTWRKDYRNEYQPLQRQNRMDIHLKQRHYHRMTRALSHFHHQCMRKIIVPNWYKGPMTLGSWNGRRITGLQRKKKCNILMPFWKAAMTFSGSQIISKNLWIFKKKVFLLRMLLWCIRTHGRLNDCCMPSIGPRITTAYMWIPRSAN